MTDLDMTYRDPNGINAHLKCAFEDVIAEPDEVHSIDCCWRIYFSCFECWKNCCYKLSTFLCGMCIAMSLGCDFAAKSFTHIWCFTPMLRKMAIDCHVFQKCCGMYTQCCIAPICEACGACFSRIKIAKS